MAYCFVVKNTICEEKSMVVVKSGGEPTCSAKVTILHPKLDETIGAGDGQTVLTYLRGGGGGSV